MKTIKKHIKSKRYGYVGREADVEIFQLQSKTDGERVVVYRWVDNNDLEIAHIKGDGRTKNFQKFSVAIIPNGTADDIKTHLNAILSQ
jgi:hypothetical protein